MTDRELETQTHTHRHTQTSREIRGERQVERKRLSYRGAVTNALKLMVKELVEKGMLHLGSCILYVESFIGHRDQATVISLLSSFVFFHYRFW